jgi:hypothetical protein
MRIYNLAENAGVDFSIHTAQNATKDIFPTQFQPCASDF